MYLVPHSTRCYWTIRFEYSASHGARARQWALPTSKEKQLGTSNQERNIAHALQSQEKGIIILYGSQTGTGEDYSRRFSRKLHEDYGISSIVADIEEFDASSLFNVAATTDTKPMVCFILATYGDGEPTDNAATFYEDLCAYESEDHDGTPPLQGLQYFAFGLGNSTYEKYNFMVRSFDQHLQKLGGSRIGPVGEGDDGTGSLDEDFLTWRDDTLSEVASTLGIEKHRGPFLSPYSTAETTELDSKSSEVYLGERTAIQLKNKGLPVGPFHAKNPYLAPLAYSKQLFALTCGRHCLHLEFDVTGTNLEYDTGDHLGIWPVNPEVEVQRLLRILNLAGKGNTVITVSTDADSGVPVFVGQPTTYATILRHRLEICGKVTREICSTLAEMAPAANAKTYLLQLAGDKNLFHLEITNRCLNIGQFLEMVSKSQPWPLLPFSFLIATVPSLQPRYYSISSSSQASPNRISITAAVKDEFLGGKDATRFLGLTTNYLRALTESDISGVLNSSGKYQLPSQRIESTPVRAALHVRQSHFRLPKTPETPIIMIGPGTGVAPFRAFLQDRVFAKQQLQQLGKSILFTGCRRRDEDYIYAEEWRDLEKALGSDFQIHTAFSREGREKVYVQHVMMAEQGGLFDMICNKGAWIYICGDAAHMAKDVHSTLIDIVAKGKSIDRAEAAQLIAGLRESGRIHEDVW
ncbi:NADPH-cytochrome P450 reductase [Mollisia scopiformis]|uniref:NADPH--cytochrome P450 reductase n=1 Tax=Mollisia scopiformis TaxID=149040 RepID=A0A194WZI1_MOLSC|nr:NADPH-cytochrome P450 reductase [Mollisia scopiformis]KUJ13350.1 NADPH-cytochrome P450 reductase [Mollisia scopiformis]